MRYICLLSVFLCTLARAQSVPPPTNGRLGGHPPSGWEHVKLKPVTLPPNATISIAARALRGTVVIVWNGNSYGTGFWLDDTHVATCYHVVGNSAHVSIGVVEEDVGSIDPEDHTTKSSNMNEMTQGTVVAVDMQHDLAIVASDSNVFVRNPRIGAFVVRGKVATPDLAIPTVRADELDDGDEVWLVGYPAGVQHPITQHGAISYLQKSLEDPRLGFYSPAYVLDQISNPGNSGGPLFDSHGAVAAILRGAPVIPPQEGVEPRPAEGISYAIPSRFLVKLASNNNVKINVAPPRHRPTTKRKSEP